MVKAVLNALNPIWWVERLARPFCWDITSYCGDWEVETNALTGEVRHRLIVCNVGGRFPSRWVPGQPPDDGFVPVDLDSLPTAEEMARRLAPANWPIPIPGNQR